MRVIACMRGWPSEVDKSIRSCLSSVHLLFYVTAGESFTCEFGGIIVLLMSCIDSLDDRSDAVSMSVEA